MNTYDLLDNIEKALDGIDLDEAVELRDAEEFDSCWVRIFNITRNTEHNAEYPQSENDKLREKAFLKAYSVCKDDDIAAFVSDDFGLIFDAEVLGIADPWLEKLIDSYRRSVFPCGRL